MGGGVRNMVIKLTCRHWHSVSPGFYFCQCFKSGTYSAAGFKPQYEHVHVAALPTVARAVKSCDRCCSCGCLIIVQQVTLLQCRYPWKVHLVL